MHRKQRRPRGRSHRQARVGAARFRVARDARTLAAGTSTAKVPEPPPPDLPPLEPDDFPAEEEPEPEEMPVPQQPEEEPVPA